MRFFYGTSNSPDRQEAEGADAASPSEERDPQAADAKEVPASPPKSIRQFQLEESADLQEQVVALERSIRETAEVVGELSRDCATLPARVVTLEEGFRRTLELIVELSQSTQDRCEKLESGQRVTEASIGELAAELRARQLRGDAQAQGEAVEQIREEAIKELAEGVSALDEIHKDLRGVRQPDITTPRTEDRIASVSDECKRTASLIEELRSSVDGRISMLEERKDIVDSRVFALEESISSVTDRFSAFEAGRLTVDDNLDLLRRNLEGQLAELGSEVRGLQASPERSFQGSTGEQQGRVDDAMISALQEEQARRAAVLEDSLSALRSDFQSQISQLSQAGAVPRDAPMEAEAPRADLMDEVARIRLQLQSEVEQVRAQLQAEAVGHQQAAEAEHAKMMSIISALSTSCDEQLASIRAECAGAADVVAWKETAELRMLQLLERVDAAQAVAAAARTTSQETARDESISEDLLAVLSAKFNTNVELVNEVRSELRRVSEEWQDRLRELHDGLGAERAALVEVQQFVQRARDEQDERMASALEGQAETSRVEQNRLHSMISALATSCDENFANLRSQGVEAGAAPRQLDEGLAAVWRSELQLHREAQERANTEVKEALERYLSEATSTVERRIVRLEEAQVVAAGATSEEAAARVAATAAAAATGAAVLQEEQQMGLLRSELRQEVASSIDEVVARFRENLGAIHRRMEDLQSQVATTAAAEEQQTAVSNSVQLQLGLLRTDLRQEISTSIEDATFRWREGLGAMQRRMEALEGQLATTVAVEERLAQTAGTGAATSVEQLGILRADLRQETARSLDEAVSSWRDSLAAVHRRVEGLEAGQVVVQELVAFRSAQEQAAAQLQQSLTAQLAAAAQEVVAVRDTSLRGHAELRGELDTHRTQHEQIIVELREHVNRQVGVVAQSVQQTVTTRSTEVSQLAGDLEAVREQQQSHERLREQQQLLAESQERLRKDMEAALLDVASHKEFHGQVRSAVGQIREELAKQEAAASVLHEETRENLRAQLTGIESFFRKQHGELKTALQAELVLVKPLDERATRLQQDCEALRGDLAEHKEFHAQVRTAISQLRDDLQRTKALESGHQDSQSQLRGELQEQIEGQLRTFEASLNQQHSELKAGFQAELVLARAFEDKSTHLQREVDNLFELATRTQAKNEELERLLGETSSRSIRNEQTCGEMNLHFPRQVGTLEAALQQQSQLQTKLRQDVAKSLEELAKELRLDLRKLREAITSEQASMEQDERTRLAGLSGDLRAEITALAASQERSSSELKEHFTAQIAALDSTEQERIKAIGKELEANFLRLVDDRIGGLRRELEALAASQQQLVTQLSGYEIATRQQVSDLRLEVREDVAKVRERAEALASQQATFEASLQARLDDFKVSIRSDIGATLETELLRIRRDLDGVRTLIGHLEQQEAADRGRLFEQVRLVELECGSVSRSSSERSAVLEDQLKAVKLDVDALQAERSQRAEALAILSGLRDSINEIRSQHTTTLESIRQEMDVHQNLISDLTQQLHVAKGQQAQALGRETAELRTTLASLQDALETLRTQQRTAIETTGRMLDVIKTELAEGLASIPPLRTELTVLQGEASAMTNQINEHVDLYRNMAAIIARLRRDVDAGGAVQPAGPAAPVATQTIIERVQEVPVYEMPVAEVHMVARPTPAAVPRQGTGGRVAVVETLQAGSPGLVPQAANWTSGRSPTAGVAGRASQAPEGPTLTSALQGGAATTLWRPPPTNV